MNLGVYLAVAVGGALGSLARFAAANAAALAWGLNFPYGTLIVNVAGSFIIGLFAVWTAPGEAAFGGPLTRQFILTGICGGFTTFSSFSLQTLALLEQGRWSAAAANILGSVALCLLAVWLGTLAGGLLRPA